MAEPEDCRLCEEKGDGKAAATPLTSSNNMPQDAAAVAAAAAADKAVASSPGADSLASFRLCMVPKGSDTITWLSPATLVESLDVGNCNFFFRHFSGQVVVVACVRTFEVDTSLPTSAAMGLICRSFGESPLQCSLHIAHPPLPGDSPSVVGGVLRGCCQEQRCACEEYLKAEGQAGGACLNCGHFPVAHAYLANLCSNMTPVPPSQSWTCMQAGALYVLHSPSVLAAAPWSRASAAETTPRVPSGSGSGLGLGFGRQSPAIARAGTPGSPSLPLAQSLPNVDKGKVKQAPAPKPVSSKSKESISKMQPAVDKKKVGLFRKRLSAMAPQEIDEIEEVQMKALPTVSTENMGRLRSQSEFYFDGQKAQSWKAQLDMLLHHPMYLATIKKLITHLRNKGMKVEGIFRMSGNHEKVAALKDSCDHVGDGVYLEGYDIHTIAGVLKMYLRQSHHPLLPFQLAERLYAAADLKNEELRIKYFRSMVKCIPPPNRETISMLSKFLKELSSHAATNKMHEHNLAIIFGPLVLRRPGDDATSVMMDDADKASNVVLAFIANCDAIFEKENQGGDPDVILERYFVTAPHEATNPAEVSVSVNDLVWVFSVRERDQMCAVELERKQTDTGEPVIGLIPCFCVDFRNPQPPVIVKEASAPVLGAALPSPSSSRLEDKPKRRHSIRLFKS
mmetsp:Transcript_50558/g.126973  ORF Transcript_50558/g.126973 Transcript_50558/m.126973 type:complete len:678 (+) Transcript_50558:375-2408(+)